MRCFIIAILMTWLSPSVYAASNWQKLSEDQEAVLEIDVDSIALKNGRVTILQRNSSKKIDSILYFVLSMPVSECQSRYGTIRYEQLGGSGKSGEWVWIKNEQTVSWYLAANLCEAVGKM